MASTLNVVFGAIVAALVFSCIGLAVARRIAHASLAWPLAPLLGWDEARRQAEIEVFVAECKEERRWLGEA